MNEKELLSEVIKLSERTAEMFTKTSQIIEMMNHKIGELEKRIKQLEGKKK